MKTLFPVLIMISSVVLWSQAQVEQETVSPQTTPTSAASAGYSIVDRGPHHRLWAKVTWRTNALGRITVHTNSYTELSTGLHYPRDGRWAEASENIGVVPGGGAVTNAGHQILLSANADTVALPYSFPVVISDPYQPPTFTADPEFTAVCQQWCWTDDSGYWKIPIPGLDATRLSYEFPEEVTYEFLGTGNFAVEVFDEGHIPYAATFRVYGTW